MSPTWRESGSRTDDVGSPGMGMPGRPFSHSGRGSHATPGATVPMIEHAGRPGAAMLMGWQRRHHESSWLWVDHIAVMATAAIREEREGALLPKVVVRASLASS